MVASATDIFGAGSASSVFFSKLTGGGATDAQQAAKTVVDSSRREINRIRGYKARLTPAENKQLGEIQEKISKINSRINSGTARQDELDDREILFLDADIIIGKPSAGVENDDFLDDIREKIDDVLTKRFTPQEQKRLDILEKLKENFQDRLNDNPDSVIAIKQIQNVQYQINQIDTPRNVSQLSVNEKREYNDLVDQANDHAGAKLLLNSRDSIRVQNLQETINLVASSLPDDPAGQPTAASVSRAYGRLLGV